MTPLGFESSDGLQNLTESFLAARVVAPGIYVVMHNHVFPVDQVRKDRERAQFVRALSFQRGPRSPTRPPSGSRCPAAAQELHAAFLPELRQRQRAQMDSRRHAVL